FRGVTSFSVEYRDDKKDVRKSG
ncbi:hypothetical protein Tco_0274499, partial [Tanacetum coccineum]